MKPLNARQEKFCQNLVMGMSATQAYIAAGFSAKGANSAASKLKSQPQIDARLTELRDGAAQVADFSRQDVLNNLAAAYNLAMREQAIGHAISAMDKYSKICGYDAAEKRREAALEAALEAGELGESGGSDAPGQVVVTFDAETVDASPRSPT